MIDEDPFGDLAFVEDKRGCLYGGIPKSHYSIGANQRHVITYVGLSCFFQIRVNLILV